MVMPTRALRTTGLTPFTVTRRVAGRDARTGRRAAGGPRSSLARLTLCLRGTTTPVGGHRLGAAVDQRHLDGVVDVGDVAHLDRVDAEVAAAEGDEQRLAPGGDVLGDDRPGGVGGVEPGDRDAGDRHPGGDDAGRERRRRHRRGRRLRDARAGGPPGPSRSPPEPNRVAASSPRFPSRGPEDIRGDASGGCGFLDARPGTGRAGAQAKTLTRRPRWPSGSGCGEVAGGPHGRPSGRLGLRDGRGSRPRRAAGAWRTPRSRWRRPRRPPAGWVRCPRSRGLTGGGGGAGGGRGTHLRLGAGLRQGGGLGLAVGLHHRGAHQGLDDQERRPPGDQRQADGPDQAAQGRVGDVEALAAADPEGDREARSGRRRRGARPIHISMGDGACSSPERALLRGRALRHQARPDSRRRSSRWRSKRKRTSWSWVATGGSTKAIATRHGWSPASSGSQRTTRPLSGQRADRPAALDGDRQHRPRRERGRGAQQHAAAGEVLGDRTDARRRRPGARELAGLGHEVDGHAHGAAALHAARAPRPRGAV